MSEITDERLAEIVSDLRNGIEQHHRWQDHRFTNALGYIVDQQRRRAVEVWQPIESAPRDGRIIIGWSAGWTSPTAIQWVDELKYQGEYGEVCEPADWDWNGTIQCPPSHNPTHWMPLPPPPSAPKQEKP
jgi:hypothetical protein